MRAPTNGSSGTFTNEIDMSFFCARKFLAYLAMLFDHLVALTTTLHLPESHRCSIGTPKFFPAFIIRFRLRVLATVGRVLASDPEVVGTIAALLPEDLSYKSSVRASARHRKSNSLSSSICFEALSAIPR